MPESTEPATEPDLRPTPPPGFVLIPCDAEPKHPGMYMPGGPEDEYFLPSCIYCRDSDQWRRDREARHAKHKPILRTRAGRKITGWAYSLGIISGSCWSYNDLCDGCGEIYLRGSRPYILGLNRSEWTCILRYHHWPSPDKIGLGMCSKCLPCDVCGSTEAWHRHWRELEEATTDEEPA